MNREQNLARRGVAEFFKQHPDAAAFFIVAGLELEYVRMAILGVLTEDVQPGDKRGYAVIVKRVVAQRERDRLSVATGEYHGPDIGTGSSSVPPTELPPPVMTMRQLDPKTPGIPWWSEGRILVRLVDPDRMMARIDEVQRLPADQGGGASGGLLKTLPMIGRHRELRRVTVRQIEKVRALKLKFPHCGAVVDRVQSALHARAIAGTWAQIPPILLKGGPGTGKTTFARELARCLGVDFFQVAASHDILKLTGLGPPWRGATVGAIAMALGKAVGKGDEPGCANPILLIDELDKAGGQIRSADSGSSGGFFDQLLCIEPQNANLIDAYLGDSVPVCVRYLSWIFTANDINKIPDYLLSRMEVFDIGQPTPMDYRAGLLHSIFETLVEQLPYGALFAPVLNDAVVDHLAESGMSPREIRRGLEEAMEGAIGAYQVPPARGSVQLTPAHFRHKSVAPKKQQIGFIQEMAA
ncbi:MAG: AAA family ATPase [Candidatus Dechloromonas phosphoritropha]